MSHNFESFIVTGATWKVLMLLLLNLCADLDYYSNFCASIMLSSVMIPSWILIWNANVSSFRSDKKIFV